MVKEDIGRIPIVDNGTLVGIVTRSDLLEAHKLRLAGRAPGTASPTHDAYGVAESMMRSNAPLIAESR
jgi:predicted transcriptional regulator